MAKFSRNYPHRLILTLAVLLLALTVTAVSAAHLGTDFEGSDGNLEVDGSGRDWGSFIDANENVSPALKIGEDESYSGTDDSFANGASEDDPEPNVSPNGGNVPQKNDLTRFYVAQDKVDVDNVEKDFLYLAWERACKKPKTGPGCTSPSGTANIDFEFNQNLPDPGLGNGVTPLRKDGDLLITYDFEGGTEVIIRLRRWNEACLCWGPPQDLGAFAEGWVNEIDVLDPFTGEKLVPLTFGEAMINLTDAGVFDTDVCTNFGSAYLKSRASTSFTANMKDFIAPINVDVSNCGSLNLNIATEPGDATGSYSFSAIEGEPVVSEVTDDSASYDLNPGTTYTFTVTAPPAEWNGDVLINPGYDLTAIDCSIEGTATILSTDLSTGTVVLTAEEDAVVNCTFTYTQRGSIIVAKVTDPATDNTTQFQVTASGSGAISGAASRPLTGGASTYYEVTRGTYSIAETLPAGWDLTGDTCQNLVVIAGDTVNCQLTNTQRGHLVVTKVTDPPTDITTLFQVTASGSGTISGAASRPLTGGASTDYEVTPGTFSIAETFPAGWDQTGDTCQNVVVSAGDTVNCQLTNTQRGHLVVTKVTDPPTDITTLFQVTASGSGTISGAASRPLTGGASTDYEVTPGTFSIAETFPAGWDLTGDTCQNVVVNAGDTVNCQLTNTKRGNIIIEKQTLPDGDPASFTFSGDVSGTLADGRTAEVEVIPGTYYSTETVPYGWDLTDITCEDNDSFGDIGTAEATFSVDPGETVKCTFTNVKRGTIIIQKVISGPTPTGYTQLFNITLEGPGFNDSFDLDQYGLNQNQTIGEEYDNLVAGNYSISESGLDGWVMVGITCTDGAGPVDTNPIQLDAGATVTCEVTNKMQLYFGSQGYWHDPVPRLYDTEEEFQPFIDWLIFNNPLVYGKEGQELDLDTVTAIFENGQSSDEKRLLTKLTAVKLDLAASVIELDWPHARLYRECLLDLSTMPEALAYFPEGDTVGDVVNYVEPYWDGDLSTSTWSFDRLTDAQVSMFSNILNGIYLGPLVLVDPTTYPDNPGCLQKLAIRPTGSLGEGEFGTDNVSSLLQGTVGVRYSLFLEATGGTLPYTWSVSGSLPADLSLNPSSGEISGIPTTAVVGQTFEVQVTDFDDSTDTALLSITINDVPNITTTSLPYGAAGTPYGETLTVTGGTSPVTWDIFLGDLPDGLSLSADGLISGTPTANDAQTFTVRVTDNVGAIDTQELLLIIGTAVVTSSLPDGTVGMFYSEPLEADGGTPPYSWLTLDTLPPGLSLSASGMITGTPSLYGTYPFTVEVMDTLGDIDTQDLTITINLPPDITTTSLPQGTEGAFYSQDLTADFGTQPLSWSSGDLPNWLDIDSATGEISGTPTAAGPYPFTVQVMDTAGAIDTQPLTININRPPDITTTSLPEGTEDTFYTQDLTADFGTQPLSWSSGDLPNWLGLDSVTGEISGTPTVAGLYPFTVQVMDNAEAIDTQDLTITINPPPDITTTSLPQGTQDTLYTQDLTADFGTQPLSWSSGDLPNWLSLDSATGEISGTPTADGRSDFNVQVMDAAGAIDTQPLSITINPPVDITTVSLPQGTEGASYNQDLIAIDGTPPYAWATSDALPAGLSLSLDGVIDGTPTAEGTYPFTVEVTDQAEATDVQLLSIDINAELVITTTALGEGTSGAPYSESLEAIGGTLSREWTLLSGTLPDGLGLSAAGVISGTTTSVGTYPFITVQVKDEAEATDTQVLSLTINAPPDITTTSLPVGMVGKPYSDTLLTWTGGTSPVTWDIILDDLPAGLTLSASGLISGSPTVAVEGQTFTVEVTDYYRVSDSQVLSITIVPLLEIGPVIVSQGAGGDSGYEGTVGVFYSVTPEASGGMPPYMLWAVISGSLPADLNLNSGTGEISGTPTAVEEQTFTLQVTDSLGFTGYMEITIKINARPMLTTTLLGRWVGKRALSRHLPQYHRRNGRPDLRASQGEQAAYRAFP